MAMLVVYHDGPTEYVTIDTQDFTDDEFEEEYGGRPEHRVDIPDDDRLTPFPTDRALRAA